MGQLFSLLGNQMLNCANQNNQQETRKEMPCEDKGQHNGV